LEEESKISNVKLPAHRAGFPGNEISFFIVPLDPAYKAGLTGHLPVTVQRWESLENWKNELRAKGNVGNRPHSTESKGRGFSFMKNKIPPIINWLQKYPP
jgi:hypothetical protein